ncbi:WAP four-disulfide core domain protein 5-like [Amphibalanus amphitrite]|uniref:WAP four-disulfide core domain protein 5-like n=1 Tax=Amphibalanus amphitrite TaxID=1232801 RepID=UPI001C903BCB|nr:WAP four-disulfide core domain protein 5-like [Amphibalanus amphitrite]
MEGRSVIALLALATLLAEPALGYCSSAGGGQCPIDRLGPRVRCAGIDEKCSSNADCPAGQGCCRRVCARACFPVCQPACADGEECELQKDGLSSVCTTLQCPFDDLGPIVRCRGPRVDSCSGNSVCSEGRACCFYGCNKSCLPACKTPCPAGQRCTYNRDQQVSSCQPF